MNNLGDVPTPDLQGTPFTDFYNSAPQSILHLMAGISYSQVYDVETGKVKTNLNVESFTTLIEQLLKTISQESLSSEEVEFFEDAIGLIKRNGGDAESIHKLLSSFPKFPGV